MKIIVASSNKGKIKEIKNLLPNDEVIPFSEILEPFEIIEDGESFKQNAIIKVKAVNEKLKQKGFKEYLILADDSGISVPALQNEPGIYSARYAGEGASDQQNNQKLIAQIEKLGLKRTEAFYTASIAICFKDTIYTTHGWMYGDVVIQERGENGFGYDPLFIPDGFDKTLGELDGEVKKQIGHRAKALNRAMKIIKSVLKSSIK